MIFGENRTKATQTDQYGLYTVIGLEVVVNKVFDLPPEIKL